MKNKNVKVIDEHNIDRNANIMFALELEGSEYVVYWIERDEESNNVFVSKVLRDIDGTYSMLNIDDSDKKEELASIVKTLISTAVSDQNDKLVGVTTTLPNGKIVKFVVVIFNKEQQINVQKTYITTVKKEVTKVAENYYDVVVETPKVVEAAPVVASVEEPLNEVFPELVTPAVAEPITTSAVEAPVVSTPVEVVPEPVAPVSVETPAVVVPTPVVTEPVVAPVVETPVVAVPATPEPTSAPVVEAPVVSTPVEVVPEPVAPASAVVTPAPVVAEPIVAPVVETPVVAVPATPEPTSAPVVETPKVSEPAAVLPTPVVPEAIADPGFVANQPLVFNASKEKNLNAALGEVASSTTIPVENIEPVKEFGVDEPVKQAVPEAAPAVAPMVQSTVASEPKMLTKKAGFANSKFFMVVAVAFFVASCVFLGYEVFNYFQLIK